MRPVLVVAVDDDEPVLEQLVGILVDVDVGRVRDVVALAFEEAHELDSPGEELPLRAGCPRTVERDVGRGAVAAVRIEALASPRVVRLPGVHGRDDEDLGADGRLRLHDEEDAARRAAVNRDEPGRVVPARPVLADGDGVRHRPRRAHFSGDRIGCGPRLSRTLRRRRAAREAFDQAAAGASVPAEAIDVHAVRGGRGGRHVQVDGLAGERAELGRIPVHGTDHRVGCRPGE
jgi:hypothetical protein